MMFTKNRMENAVLAERKCPMSIHRNGFMFNLVNRKCPSAKHKQFELKKKGSNNKLFSARGAISGEMFTLFLTFVTCIILSSNRQTLEAVSRID